jgi:hypothetical protein
LLFPRGVWALARSPGEFVKIELLHCSLARCRPPSWSWGGLGSLIPLGVGLLVTRVIILKIIYSPRPGVRAVAVLRFGEWWAPRPGEIAVAVLRCGEWVAKIIHALAQERELLLSSVLASGGPLVQERELLLSSVVASGWLNKVVLCRDRFVQNACDSMGHRTRTESRGVR